MYNMKLNSAKCIFEVSVGKFLGFMVTQRGIEVSPDQIKVVMETSTLTTLGRFMARFTDKLRPFFLTLKGASETRWTNDCVQAFREIKRYLMQPPILSSPQPGEQLYMYLAVFDCAVNVVLFLHKKGKE
ncbi:hypothetical protein AAG906_032975 [Vitis piasezkii]